MPTLHDIATLNEALLEYAIYLDSEPEDHFRFPKYANIYWNIPEKLAEEYWQNV